ncbi:MAG TPA: beta-N-acetylhexosaminidase [Terriglobales bacterium]
MVVRKTGARKQQVGQLLIIGFDGTALTPRLRDLLRHVQPSGVILFARNIVDADQTHRLLKDCRNAVKHPIFTCVDMEGGTVDRLRAVFGPTPSAADVFATGNPRLFRKHGELIGHACHMTGFNLDLAPVVDLALSSSRKVMTSRSVSADPDQVSAYARHFLTGLGAKHVFGAIKHFPGLGAATLDTHHDLPRVSRSSQRLWDEDLLPYRKLRRYTPFVLVGHASYPEITQHAVPASLSVHWITQVLRKQIGYDGVVISDDLEMGAILKTMSIGQATVRHIRAGGDLCLVCHQEQHVLAAFEALRRAADDPTSAPRIAESLRRIRALRKQSRAFFQHPIAPTATKVRTFSRQLWEFAEEVRLKSISRQAEA